MIVLTYTVQHYIRLRGHRDASIRILHDFVKLIGWAGHVAFTGERRGAHRVVVGKQGKHTRKRYVVKHNLMTEVYLMTM